MLLQRLGFLLTASGVLIIVGYYMLGLLMYLFAMDFLPFPVRVAIPLVVGGVLLSLAAWSWDAIRRNVRVRQGEDVRDRVTEYETERPEFLAHQLLGSND